MKKHLYTFTIVLILGAAVSLFIYNYTRKEAPIPPLLERHGPISTTSEWVNTKAAIAGLQRKLRDKPGDIQSKLLLALAYMQEARVTGEHPYYYPAALGLVEDIIKRNPSDKDILFEAIVAKATIQLSLHQFKEALETGNKALSMRAGSAAVWGVLCDANVELGNYEEAIEAADKMVAIRPDLKSYSRVSYLREIHGDMEGAISAMDMAAKAGFPGLEQTAWARVTLGNLYEKTGDHNTAEMHYRVALAEYPNYAFALGGLASLETAKKNYKEAIKLYTEALHVLPEFSFQEKLTQLYTLTGQKQKAKKTYTELLEGLEEDQESGHLIDLELASIYLELGNDPAKAMQHAMKEYERRPNNIDVCKAMALIHYKRGDLKTAHTFLTKAKRTNKQDAELLVLDGLVSYKLGEKSFGAAQIKKALSINPFQEGELAVEGRQVLNTALASF